MHFASAIGGAMNVRQQGSGTVALSGTNTFTGATSIASGILAFDAPNALRDTSGVSIRGGAGLTYTGAAANFGRSVTIVPGSGTGTIRNSGGGVLTLSGNLSKDDSILRFTGGAFNVTGVITGLTPGTSDLIVDDALVTFWNVNTYDGPTFVYGSGMLALGIDDAIPNASVVTLGNATSRGTLDTGSFTDTVAGLVFSGLGGTLRVSGDRTTSAHVASTGGITLGSNADLVLTTAGSTVGLYRLVAAPSVSGAFASVSGTSAAYQVVYTATSVDYQQRAVLGAVTVNAPSAYGGVSTTGTVSVNVLNHSLASFQSSNLAALSLNLGTYENGVWTSGSNVFTTGWSRFANLAAGSANGFTASALSPGTLAQGSYQGVYTLRFRDQQDLSGAINTRDLTLTLNVIVVPEPGAVALAAIGVAAAAWATRRRAQPRRG